ncbi:MAG: hypothetical protein JXR89_07165 [Deltaproteobacteria bacterium]|nr:hypothetical protein [Deltaproteobacteria bacterium]
MKKTGKAVYLAILAGWLWLPAAGPAGARQEKLIAAQISVIRETSWPAFQGYLEELKACGYNTIILRVFHNRGDRYHGPIGAEARNRFEEGVYFQNGALPVIADLLTPACAAAHRVGLRVIAWMTTLQAAYGQKVTPPLTGYDPVKDCLYEEKQLLDPSEISSRSFLLRIFRDLAAGPIDGVLLQDDLMLRHHQGFFKKIPELSPNPEELYRFSPDRRKILAYRKRFFRWRNDQALILQALANAIFSACRQIRPGLICAQNVHYEPFLNQDWGRNWFACTPESLAASQADYLMVMAYQNRIKRELELADDRLRPVMEKIFRQGRIFFPDKAVFKFEVPSPESKNRAALLTELKKTLRLAQAGGVQELVLSPCNYPEEAACLLLLDKNSDSAFTPPDNPVKLVTRIPLKANAVD